MSWKDAVQNKTRLKIATTRITLVAFFSMITLLQLFSIPGQLRHMGEMNGISLLIEIVLTTLASSSLLVVQFSIIAVWKVIGHIQSGSFFTPESLIWIGRLVLALKILIFPPVLLFLILAPQADDPGFFVLLITLTLFILLFATTASLLRDQISTRVSP